jgi:hypothetical protein
MDTKICLENLKENKTASVRKGNFGALSSNYFGRERATSIIYSEFISVIFSYLAYKEYAPYNVVICGLLQSIRFSTGSHKRHKFRKKFIEHGIWVLIFSTVLFSF